MSRIKKEKAEYYQRRMKKLFEDEPSAKLVAQRYRTIRYTLLEKHPFIETLPKSQVLEFLKEVCYIDRKLRLNTTGIEKEKKKILSQKFILEDLDYEVGYYQVIKQIKL